MICYGHVLEDDAMHIETTGLPVHKRVVCVKRKVKPVVCVLDYCMSSTFPPVVSATPVATCGALDVLTQIEKNCSDKAALLDLLQQVRVMLRSILKSSEHAPVLTATLTVVVDAVLFSLYKQKAYAVLVATDLLHPITDAVAKGILEEVETNAKSIITFGDSSKELSFVALAEIDRQIAARRQFLFDRDDLPGIKQRAAEREEVIQAAREAGAVEGEIDLYY
jgi:hypothetical protein